MITLSGKQLGKEWSGHFLTDSGKAIGQINGYSWFFQSKDNHWMIEIADDITLEPTDLPLVGYGCAGWLYQSDAAIHDHELADPALLIETVTHLLDGVFELFSQNKLDYLPAITCACSE
jgi:hypothetical protein